MIPSSRSSVRRVARKAAAEWADRIDTLVFHEIASTNLFHDRGPSNDGAAEHVRRLRALVALGPAARLPEGPTAFFIPGRWACLFQRELMRGVRGRLSRLADELDEVRGSYYEVSP